MKKVSYQLVTNPCCGVAVIFCSFISHLIGCETINIPEIFSGAHSFTEKTVHKFMNAYYIRNRHLPSLDLVYDSHVYKILIFMLQVWLQLEGVM